MRRRFGWIKELVPVVGQGTWQMGAPRDRKIETETIALGLDLGLSHLDTAELYGDGRAEELLAEVIHGPVRARRREDLFIVSKVLPSHATHAGTIAACEASLKRLRIDYLDLYLLHWPGKVPIAETMGALEELVRAGKIRALGVSNFDVPDLEMAEKALTRERLACNQVCYHLGERGVERRVIPWCQARDIAVVGYSPFGSGRFVAPSSPGGRVLAEVARRRRATPRQVALAFLSRLPGTFTIPKASRPEHVRDNAGALELTLSDEDVMSLEDAFPIGPEGPLALV
jgi:diketogulonate reductase-like aldo/keto reductase